MKRLPKNFVVVNRHYVFRNKHSVQLFRFGGGTGNAKYWYHIRTLQNFANKKDAIKYGKLTAQQYRIGYIYGITRGEKYRAKHRACMILYDRDDTINIKPGGNVK